MMTGKVKKRDEKGSRVLKEVFKCQISATGGNGWCPIPSELMPTGKTGTEIRKVNQGVQGREGVPKECQGVFEVPQEVRVCACHPVEECQMLSFLP